MGKETYHSHRVLVLLICLGIGHVLTGSAGAQERIGLPQDWSNRHVIYTNGASPEVAAAAARDPRSWINWTHKSMGYFRKGPGYPPLPPPWRYPLNKGKIDWAVSLGTAGGMPIGETPAKYSFDANGNYSCASDFVVFVINATPGAGQANVVSLNNLYTGTASSSCPNSPPQTPPTTNYTAPTFMWSYAVGSAGIALSPALSLDGKKIAFIEGSNSHAYLDVLTWTSGQGTDATHPMVLGTSNPALVRLDYTNGTGCGTASSDANSSPYVDYNHDVLYVGASNGALYRINDVFKGAPKVAYCIAVSTTHVNLTSPVYDQVRNIVYVSDGFSVYAYTPGATGFTLIRSIAVAGTGAAADPIVLSPIVDSTNGFVYVFSGENLGNTNAIVSQMTSDLTSQVTAAIGPGKTGNFILDGDFDNQYYTNGPSGGTLYACGTQANSANRPGLYAISFQANGTMNSAPAMSDNRNINGGSTLNGVCSPLVEFFDGTTDRLFVGAGAFGATSGANLVTEWNITTRITSSTGTPAFTATNEWGGTSAFTIDNIAPVPQAASIYFGTLAAVPNGQTAPCGRGNYCAVKLTRAGLQ